MDGVKLPSPQLFDTLLSLVCGFGLVTTLRIGNASGTEKRFVSILDR